MHYFSVDRLPRSAWKNGGGTTREVMSWPAGADFSSFDWRVSVATISSSGPFSRFEGIHRIIMLLAGDGVLLRGSQVEHRLDEVEQPFAFSGDVELVSELLGTESTDFNVMTRHSVAAAQVAILDASSNVAARDGGLVMCLSGCWSFEQQPIGQWQGFWWADGVGPFAIEKTSAGVAKLVWVSWTRW